MHPIRHALVVLFCLAASLIRAEYFVIRDYKVDIKIIGSEAMFEVKEYITVEFSEPRRGIRRRIPFRYSIDGNEMDLKIYDVKVENTRFTTSKEGTELVVKIGDADIYVEGVQTYVITYKVKKAWIFAKDHTEFYWNIIGSKWSVPIDTISYSVTLDRALPMTEKDYYIYTGLSGEKGKDASVSYYLNKFEGHSLRPFGPNEGLTLAINLPLEYIIRPGKWEELWEKYGTGGIGGFLLMLVSGLYYRTWSKYGKDYPIVRMVQYTPPKELNPAEAGVLIDEKADNVDILALLPYWAHNGHITIRRIQQKWGKDDHEFTKIKDLPEDAGPYEKIVFDGLFNNSNTVLVSNLENNFYEYLQSAKSSLKSHLGTMGIYYPVSVKMQLYSGLAAFVLALLALLTGFVFKSFVIAGALGLSSVIGFVFANYMLKKNEKGVHLYQQVLGFKMFVKAAEKDKIEWLLKEDPDYFEKTLPYAMIFGYAKQWSKKFDGLLLEPPKWYITPGGYYYGGNTFTPSDFGASFDNSIHDIQSVFTSVPAGTGGGGGSFSGGGSSGGGFGGGGGDSW